MPSQEEILSRLAALGTTAVGGSSTYANQLPLLNSAGYLDASFYSSVIIAAVYTAADEAARLALSGLKPGDTVVQTSPAEAYILQSLPSSNPANWVLVGITDVANATAINYTAAHSGGVLTGFSGTLFNALAAIDLGKLSLSIANVLTAVHTFDTGAAPFAIGSTSAGQLVTGLNAEKVGGANLASLRDATNLSAGTLSVDRLTGTYAISITGNAQTATNAVSATTAITASTATSATEAAHAVEADHADNADMALDSQKLNNQLPAYYRNADNLNAGTLPAARFNDVSHGDRAGGTLHAVATDTVPGFMSAEDFCKLQTIEAGAEANNNAFVTFEGTVGSTAAGTQTSTFKFDSASPELSITVSGGATAKATWEIDWSAVLHNSLGGLTLQDPHTQYVHKDNARTLTAVHTFNGAGVPFIIGAAARGTTVDYLDADLLDGRHASFFQNAVNLTSGTIPVARLTGTYDINITGTASGGLPVSGGILAGPLTVPQLTIGSLSGVLKAVGGLVSGSATTGDLPEGARLYFTNDRVDARVAALIQNGTNITWTYDGGAHTLTGNVTGVPADTDDLDEGATNQYFTIARVRAALSGIAPITYDDSTGEIGIDAAYVNTPNTLVYRDSNGDFAASHITVSAPTAGGHATNKTYVDAGLAGKAETDHVHDVVTTSVDGFMSAADKVTVDRLAVLLDNAKRARSFCPAFRLEGPSTAKVLFYNQRSAYVRGNPANSYTLTVRVRGWFKEQHGWGIQVSSPAATVWVHEAVSTLPAITNPAAPEYVDEEVVLTVNGKARVSLFYYLRDGLIPTTMPDMVANVLPDPATFNGTYLLLEPVSLTGDYTAYGPDILPVSIDGEMVGGLLSGYTANSGYNGEGSDDIDDIIRSYTNSEVPPAFPDYTLVTAGKTNAQLRTCQVSALNKIEGFNGYLRLNPFVVGRHPSAPITDDVDHLDEILVNSGKLYQNIVSGSFTLGTRGTTFTVGGGTTFQDLFDQINTNSAGKITVTYNPATDKITLTNSQTPTEDQDASVYYDPAGGAFLGTIRASASETHRTSPISLPVASGIRVADTLKTANFKLPVSPDTGSFFIDGVLFNYDATTDTVAATLAAINVALPNSEVSYDPLSNTFKLQKKQFSFLPPDAYDITGNFLQATRLERENNGNPEFPIAAIHSLHVTETAVLAGGSFRNFKGATLAGLAKLNFDKNVDTLFDTVGGFDYPVAFVSPLAGTTDVLVGCTEPASFNGSNRKYLFRIKADGTEDNTFNLATQSITDDGQDRVLGAVSLNSNNDIAVLTPRELHVYSITGTLLCRYRGSRAFHGLVKQQDNKVLVASNAYSSLAAPQKWDLDAVVPLDEPLGLKLLVYDPNADTVTIDPVWVQTPTVTSGVLGAGAGTGAESSCAYPIIGGVGADSFVIAANRGALFGSGYTSGYGDTSWNSREVGNLLLHSERFSNPANPGDTNWAWDKLGNITLTETTVGTDEYWTTLDRSNANDVAYVEQHVDMTTVRNRLDLDPVTNTGSVGYRYMVKFIQDTGFNNKFPVMNVRLTGGAPENDRQVNCYINLATGAVTLGTPTPPSMGGIVANSTTVASQTGGPDTYIVTLTFADDVVANTQLYCTIYPAYATVAGNPVEATTGSCQVSAASLMLVAWPNTYTRTTTQPKYPASGSNAPRFRGLYKIGLEGQKKGAADTNWNCVLEYSASEPHSHAIPFCVDSLNRVYLGGPITGIKNQAGDIVPVTPWRLYRLTADGRFDKEYDFNDRVLAAKITPCNKLVVGGRFSCCGKSFVGKLAYLSLDGAVLSSLTNYVDLISGSVAPETDEEPCNKNKLWLDTSAVPAVLKAWNEDNSDWQAAIDTNSLVPRLPAPEFVVTYPVSGQLVNPSEIYLICPGHSNATIYYGINQDPRVLAYRLTYDELVGIELEDAGTFTINAYAVGADFEDSKLSSATFTVQPLVGVIEFDPASGTDFEGAGSVEIDVPSTNLESLFYQISVNGGAFSTEQPYTGALTIQQNVQVRARAARTGYRDAIATATYTIHLAAPTVTYTRINSGDPDSSKNGISLATTSPDAIIRYTVDGTVPTMQNGQTYSAIIDLLNNSLYTNDQFVLKAKAFNVPNGTESQVTVETVTRLAVPTFNPTGTGLIEGSSVTLTGTGNPGEVIRYTINGATPTEDGAGGTTYSAPITFAPEEIVNHTVQLKVRVYRLANDPLWVSAVPSALIDRTYTVQIPPPTMSVENSSTLGITKIFLNSSNSQTPNATIIRYTLDGTTPSKASGNASTTTYQSAGIVTADIANANFVNNVLTLKVIEYYAADNYVPAVAEFTVTRCAAPTAINPTDNIVVFGLPVTFTPATGDSYKFYFMANSNAVINGSTVGRLYDADLGLVFTNDDIINGSVDLRVRAFRNNFLPSVATAKVYNMKVPPVYFDPFPLAVDPGYVSLYNIVQGVVIKFTMNGASPNQHSRLYSNPVQILVDTTIKALASKVGWVDSEIAVASYASTLYPSTPDYCLFNVKYGQNTLANTKIESWAAVDGNIEYLGTPGSGPYSGQSIFILDDPSATLASTGLHYNNLDRYQVTTKGKGAFGMTNVDFWNNLDEADQENWKPLRNYGSTGNYANYLEARKYFGCSRAPLIGTPTGTPGPINWNGGQNTQDTVTPTLLQNSGLTAVPEVDKHVMTHVRGLRAGKYLVIAYGQKTRFGIDMYSGSCVTGAEFYNYGVPALKQSHQGKFYKTTRLNYLFWGARDSVEQSGYVQNPIDGIWYEQLSTNVIAEGMLDVASPGGIIISGAAATKTATLTDYCNFAVALVESTNENDLEFHVNGRFDGAIPFGTNELSQPIINALQIIPIEGYYQPEINNDDAVMTAGPFTEGDYTIFHVHGGVDVGGTQPRFAGGFYRFTHSINSDTSGNFDRPNMTDWNQPAPNMIVGETEDGSHPAWHACDADATGTYWLATNPTSYLEVDYTVPNIVDRFSLTVDAELGAPTNFTFQAYDGVNWVVLNQQTGQFAGLTGVQTKSFLINTPIPATKYRLVTSATIDASPVKILDFDLLGKVEDTTGVTTFINLPEVGRYKTGEEECAKFTAVQKPFHHEGGNLEFAFEDITEHFNDNLVSPGLTPAAEGGGSRPIKPIFALINVSKISDQGRGPGGLPVLFDPPSGTVDP